MHEKLENLIEKCIFVEERFSEQAQAFINLSRKEQIEIVKYNETKRSLDLFFARAFPYSYLKVVKCHCGCNEEVIVGMVDENEFILFDSFLWVTKDDFNGKWVSNPNYEWYKKNHLK